jgi:hypothetical protein
MANLRVVLQLHATAGPGAMTERVSDKARACHPVPDVSGSLDAG